MTRKSPKRCIQLPLQLLIQTAFVLTATTIAYFYLRGESFNTKQQRHSVYTLKKHAPPVPTLEPSGHCLLSVDSIACNCTKDLSGITCELYVLCESNPCQNDGVCRKHQYPNTYKCTCNRGSYGQRCEHNVDECASDPCQHGGTCEDRVGGYQCLCAPGFTDFLCHADINECDSQPCIHGQCVDRINTYYCSCYTGFNGLLCEAEMPLSRKVKLASAVKTNKLFIGELREEAKMCVSATYLFILQETGYTVNCGKRKMSISATVYIFSRHTDSVVYLKQKRIDMHFRVYITYALNLNSLVTCNGSKIYYLETELNTPWIPERVNKNLAMVLQEITTVLRHIAACNPYLVLWYGDDAVVVVNTDTEDVTFFHTGTRVFSLPGCVVSQAAAGHTVTDILLVEGKTDSVKKAVRVYTLQGAKKGNNTVLQLPSKHFGSGHFHGLDKNLNLLYIADNNAYDGLTYIRFYIQSHRRDSHTMERRTLAEEILTSELAAVHHHYPYIYLLNKAGFLYVYSLYRPCGKSCGEHGQCMSETAGCVCKVDWSGETCNKYVPICASHPCQNDGTCLQRPHMYECVCAVQWTGTHCDKTTNLKQIVTHPRGYCTPDSRRCRCSGLSFGPGCQQQRNSSVVR